MPQLGLTRVVRDPNNCTNPNNPSTCAPFANNVIPTGRLSANGLAMMRALPEPIPGFFGPSGQNYFQSRPRPVNQLKSTISMDYYPTEKNNSGSVSNSITASSLTRSVAAPTARRPRSTARTRPRPSTGFGRSLRIGSPRP